MKKRIDTSNFNVQLIITGITGLVDDGNTPHQAYEILEDIKRDIFSALMEIHRENKSKVNE